VFLSDSPISLLHVTNGDVLDDNVVVERRMLRRMLLMLLILLMLLLLNANVVANVVEMWNAVS